MNILNRIDNKIQTLTITELEEFLIEYRDLMDEKMVYAMRLGVGTREIQDEREQGVNQITARIYNLRVI